MDAYIRSNHNIRAQLFGGIYRHIVQNAAIHIHHAIDPFWFKNPGDAHARPHSRIHLAAIEYLCLARP